MMSAEKKSRNPCGRHFYLKGYYVKLRYRKIWRQRHDR